MPFNVSGLGGADVVVIVFGADTSGFDRAIAAVEGRTTQSMAKLTANFRTFGAEMGLAGAAITALFGGALAKAISAASNLNESLTKSSVVFGESAKAVQDWAATAATSLGQSNQLALESAATFGNLFTTMGIGRPAAAAMSQDMVQLAADLASFNNQSPEEMLTKLRAGLVGEIEPLRTVGIAMNADTVAAKAMELGLGKTKEQISEADKVLARYALILEQSTNAQGDFARTSDGVANQTRILKARVDDLFTSFGQALLPAVQQGLGLFNQLLGFLARMPDQFKQMAVAVAAVTAATGASMVAIGGLVALLGGPLTLAIVAVVGTIAALTAAVALEWGRITQIFEGGVGNVRISFKQFAGILGAGADAVAILVRVVTISFDAIVTASRVMVAGVSGAFAALKSALLPILAGIATNNMGLFVGGLLNMKEITVDTLAKIGGSFGGFSKRIGQDVEDIQNHFTGKFKGAFERATDSVTGAVRKIGTDLEALKKGLNDAANTAKKSGEGQSAAAKKIAEAWRHSVAETAMAFVKMRGDHEQFMNDLLQTAQQSTLAWVALRKVGFDQTIKEMEEWTKRSAELLKTEAEMRQEAESKFVAVLIGGIRRRGEALKEEKKNIQQITQDWGEGMASIILAVGKMTGKTATDMAGWSNDISGIIGSMPGKFGDAARGVLRTVDQWVTFADKVLAVIGRMTGDSTLSLGTLLQKIAGIFSKSNPDVQQASDNWAGFLQGLTSEQKKQGQESEDAASKWASRITTIISGVTTFMATRHQGKAAGVLGGMAAGATIGSMFGPWGTAIGAGVGAIAGLFGSGKSAAQKAEEARQKKMAEVQTEQAIANLTSGIMDGLEKGRQLLENLSNFVAVPKEAIKKFFKQLETLLVSFVKMSAQFNSEGLAKAKEVADNLGPVFDFLIGAVDFSKAVRSLENVSDATIETLMSAISRIEAGFEKIIEKMDKTTVARASRLATKLTTVFSFVTIIPEALKAIAEAPNVTDEILARIFANATSIIDKFSAMVDTFHDYSMSKLAKSSKQFTAVFESVTSVVGALKAIGEYQPIPDSILDAVTNDIKRVTEAIGGWVDMGNVALERALNLEDVVRRLRESLARSLTGLSSLIQSQASAASTIRTQGGTTINRTSDNRIIVNGLTLGSSGDPRLAALEREFRALFGPGGFGQIARSN